MNDHVDKRGRGSGDLEVARRKIFIGGLSYDTSDESLRKYFSVYGSIEDSVVMKDPTTKRSRGFGFITFSHSLSVDNAVKDDPHTIDARKVEVKRAVPKSEIGVVATAPTKTTGANKTTAPVVSSPALMPLKKPGNQLASIAAVVGSSSMNPGLSSSQILSPVPALLPAALTLTKAMRSNSVSSTISNHSNDENKYNTEEYANNKIFAGGLHYDTRDADFKEYFEQYGKVLYGEVMFNRETHKSRGFGFIVFESEDSVDRVCEQPEHSIRDKTVEVKRAIPRSHMYVSPSSPSTDRTTPSSMSMSPRSPTSAGNNQPNSGTSISSPIRPTARRAVSGNATTVLVGNNIASSTVSMKKPSPPSSTSSYAAALQQGSEQDDMMYDISELDATTTIASNSSKNSMYDQVNLSYSSDLNRPNRAYSEPIVQLKGFASHPYLNSLYEDYSSSNGYSIGSTQANKDNNYQLSSYQHELRPPSLSFDHTISSDLNSTPSIFRSNTTSPPLAWSQIQYRSQQPNVESMGTMNSVTGLSWLATSTSSLSSQSYDQSSSSHIMNSQPQRQYSSSYDLQPTSPSTSTSSYLSSLRAHDAGQYGSQNSLANLVGLSNSPSAGRNSARTDNAWSDLVTPRSLPSPISPPRANYAMSPSSPSYYPISSPSESYSKPFPLSLPSSSYPSSYPTSSTLSQPHAGYGYNRNFSSDSHDNPCNQSLRELRSDSIEFQPDWLHR